MIGIIKAADELLGTNIMGPNSTDRAIDAQRRAASDALAAQERMYYQSREDQMPWMDAGRDSLSSLMGQMPELNRSFSMDDFQKDPGYQFRLNEGMKALEGSAAARGSLNSGATMKALMGYGQNFASNEYQNAYNRFNNDRTMKYNKLANIAGLGQTTASNLGGQSMQHGMNQGNVHMGMGNAIAAANIAQGNNMSNLMGQGMSAAALAFSDKRLKKNIKPITQNEIKEFRESIKPYFFEYISDEYGKGEWAGVMAQDLEKSKLGRMAVFENEKGEKLIDLKKLMSIFVATMAEGGA